MLNFEGDKYGDEGDRRRCKTDRSLKAVLGKPGEFGKSLRKFQRLLAAYFRGVQLWNAKPAPRAQCEGL